MRLQGAVRG